MRGRPVGRARKGCRGGVVRAEGRPGLTLKPLDRRDRIVLPVPGQRESPRTRRGDPLAGTGASVARNPALRAPLVYNTGNYVGRACASGRKARLRAAWGRARLAAGDRY